MKSIILIFIFCLFSTALTFGQIKIGDNPQNIDPSSVLELESSSKVLVITRVSTLEMEAITPLRGGVVYNTDTTCMHYYNGSNWINLCDATTLSLTNEPIENITSTISIVDNGTTINLEVAPNSIRSENIVDGGINGDDIQDNSIGESKLGADSVGADELRDNTVGGTEIIDGSITPIDMANTTPNQVLTTDSNGTVTWQNATNLRGAVADEVSITGSGTVTDPLTLTDAITASILANTTAITTHVSADNDTDNQNEVLTNAALDGNDLVLTEAGVERRVDLSSLNNAGTDNQTLNLNVNDLEISNGNNVNLAKYLDNTDEQQLTITDNTIFLTNGGSVDLPAGTVDTDNQAITGGAVVGNELRIDIEDGLSGTIDISSLTADGTETIINEGTNVTITGDGSNGNPYVVNAVGGGTGSTEEADQITITGIGTNGDPFKIQPLTPAPATDQMLITNTAGNIAWSPVGSGGGGGADDQNASEVTVAANPTNYTAVTADVEGHLAGIDAALAASGSTVVADETTITGNGTTLDPLTIVPGATGELLTTDTNGNVVWAAVPIASDDQFIDPSSSWNATTNTLGLSLDNDGVDPILFNLSSLEESAEVLANTTLITNHITTDLDTSPTNEIELPTGGNNGQILSTDGDGGYTWVNDQTASTTIISTDADNLINLGTDTGALLTVADLDTEFVTETELAALTFNDGDFDPTNEIQDLNLTNDILTITDNTGATAINLAPYLDDQTAAEVTYNPATSGLTATNTQLAIDELKTDIDAISAGDNLSNTNLTQTAGENRTYDLNGSDLVFTGSGSIGIGTTTPETKFHVSGGQVRAASFSAGNGIVAYRFAEDPDTGMYRAAADELAFDAGGAQMLLMKQTVGTGLESTFFSRLRLNSELIDVNGQSGTAGQILSSTVTGVDWIDPPPAGTNTEDTDTNDGLTTFNATTGYDVNVDDTTIEKNGDALRVKGGADGQVLTTTGGQAVWQTPAPAGGIIAMGKIQDSGAILKASPGVGSSGGGGIYVITLDASLLGLTDANYIINVTPFANSGESITAYVVNQVQNSFTIHIVRVQGNSPGTNVGLVGSGFFFTITDL